MQQLVGNNCIEQNSANNSMSIQHTNQHVSASVRVNQHVDSTHNQHVNTSVSKRQQTCRLNTPTNTLMRQSININQLVESLHQLNADCPSLHRMSIQHNQHVKTRAVHWVRSKDSYLV